MKKLKTIATLFAILTISLASGCGGGGAGAGAGANCGMTLEEYAQKTLKATGEAMTNPDATKKVCDEFNAKSPEGCVMKGADGSTVADSDVKKIRDACAQM